MGARNYYFLVAGLPDLTIDQGKLQFGSLEMREYLQSQLHKKDYQYIEWLFLPHDNKNLLNLLEKYNQPWDSLGIYTEEELELAILEIVNPDKIITDEKSPVRSYMIEFIRSYNDETRIIPEKSAENELTELYYLDALKLDNKFIAEWFAFDVDLKNMLVYNTALKFNIPFENEITVNTRLAEVLRLKSGRSMDDIAEWLYFERFNQLADNGDIAGRERAIDHLRWTVLDEMNTFNYFSIEVIFSYMIKIMMIERWLKLDPATGEQLFRKLLGDLQSGYEFPNEFSINDGK